MSDQPPNPGPFPGPPPGQYPGQNPGQYPTQGPSWATAPPPPPPGPTSTPLGPPPGQFNPGPPPGAFTPGYTPGPLTTEQFGNFTPTPVPEPPSFWKRPWFIILVIAALVGGGTFLYVNSQEDDAQDVIDDINDTEITIPEITIPDFTIPEITIPEITLPPEISLPPTVLPPITDPLITIATVPGIPVIPTVVPTATAVPGTTGAQPVVGETVTLADGTTMRVNSVTPNAPPTQDFFDVAAGSSLTRIDYDACAGTNGFASLNPLYWTGTLDDGTDASVFLFSFDIVTIQLAPGACVRSQVDFEVPAAKVVTSVAARDALFQEAARWSAASSVPVSGPLVAATPVATTPVGQPVALANGATVTLRSATSSATPIDSLAADPALQFVRIDAEICAGTSAVTANPQSWFGTATDSRIGGTAFFGSTFPSGQIAPGTCVSGMADVELPIDATIRDVMFTDESTIEVARWRVG